MTEAKNAPAIANSQPATEQNHRYFSPATVQNDALARKEAEAKQREVVLEEMEAVRKQRQETEKSNRLGVHEYGENTPTSSSSSKRRKVDKGSVWNNIKRVTVQDKNGFYAKDGSSTHYCTTCETFIKVSRDKNSRRWVTSAAVAHNSQYHPELESAK